MRPCLERQPNFERNRRRVGVPSASAYVVVRYRLQVEQRHPLAIETHLELFALRGAAVLRAKIDFQEGELEEIFTIHGEIVFDHNSTAGSYRQPGNMVVLRKIAADFVGDRLCSDVGVANGQPADLRRRADVSFEQCGRGSQNVGDVIEAFAGIVGGQNCRDIDVNGEEIANRVGVFGTIQPVQGSRSRIRSLRSRLINGCFERRSKGIQRRPIRAGRAARRHQARAKLADYLFPGFGIPCGMGCIQLFECQAAGLQLVVVTSEAVLTYQILLGSRLLRGQHRGKNGKPANGEKYPHRSSLLGNAG